MKSRAIKKHLRVSPRKLRLTIDAIRGKSYPEALAILQNIRRKSNIDVLKTVQSAKANLVGKYPDEVFEDDKLYVAEVVANPGPMMKRILPAPMGRAFRVRKRMSHLEVVIKSR